MGCNDCVAPEASTMGTLEATTKVGKVCESPYWMPKVISDGIAAKKGSMVATGITEIHGPTGRDPTMNAELPIETLVKTSGFVSASLNVKSLLMLPLGTAPQSTWNWLAFTATDSTAPSRRGIESYNVLLSRPGVSIPG